MAKFKTLIDSDGRKYFFNTESFNKAAKIKTEKKLVGDKVEKVYWKNVAADIAERCCVSEDAVNNWKKGSNGPGDIECVKTAAEILGVDYRDLMIPLNEKKENKMFTSNEKQLISDVYSRLLSFYFTYFDPAKKIFTDEEEALEIEEKRSLRINKMNKELASIHEFISTQSLFISGFVKNTLHRITADVENDPRFDNIDSELSQHSWCFVEDYYFYDSKEDYLNDNLGFGAYIVDEIALAEDLGIDYNDFDNDEVYNTEGKTKEEAVEMWMNLGVTEVEIKPIAVFKHEVELLLIDVFKHFFPELDN